MCCRGVFGEPRATARGVIGDAVDAVAGDDVVGGVELIEPILGHRALLLPKERLAGAAGCAVSSVAMGVRNVRIWSCQIND